jgi:hypothetical protein
MKKRRRAGCFVISGREGGARRKAKCKKGHEQQEREPAGQDMRLSQAASSNLSQMQKSRQRRQQNRLR